MDTLHTFSADKSFEFCLKIIVCEIKGSKQVDENRITHIKSKYIGQYKYQNFLIKQCYSSDLILLQTINKKYIFFSKLYLIIKFVVPFIEIKRHFYFNIIIRSSESDCDKHI